MTTSVSGLTSAKLIEANQHTAPPMEDAIGKSASLAPVQQILPSEEQAVSQSPGDNIRLAAEVSIEGEGGLQLSGRG
jgi:hypothetical protein